MQTAKCTVRLGGDVAQTIPNKEITCAEYLVLKSIHGEDAIVDLSSATGNDRRRHVDEMDRLRMLYGSQVIDGLFPGLAPELPRDFKSIGVTLPRATQVDGVLTGGQKGVPKPKSGNRKTKDDASGGGSSKDAPDASDETTTQVA